MTIVPETKPAVDEALSEDHSHELIPAGQGKQELLATVLGEINRQCVHNFDGDAREIWRMSAFATAGQTKAKEDAFGVTIPVKWIYCHMVQIRDVETGEISDGVRTVLMTPDKECYAFASDGIAQSVADIFRTFGFKPFDPPLELKVLPIKTRAGWQTLKLVPA